MKEILLVMCNITLSLFFYSMLPKQISPGIFVNLEYITKCNHHNMKYSF